MSIQLVTGSNNLGETVNVLNNNSNLQIINATFLNGNIVLTKYDGSNITVPLPIINTGGQVLTNAGYITLGSTSGSYNQVNISPLNYIYNSISYNILGSTNLILNNGDATLDRLDVIFIDSTSNTIKKENGIPSNPSKLNTLSSDKILIGVVYVKATASPLNNLYNLIYSVFPFQQIQTIVNNGTPKNNLYELNDINVLGVLDNQVLTYDLTSDKWIGTDKTLLNPLSSTNGLSMYGNQIKLGGNLIENTEIDINNYKLKFKNGSNSIIDLYNFTLTDSTNITSFDFDGRVLIDSNGINAVEYNQRNLNNYNNQVLLDWDVDLTLYGGTNGTSVRISDDININTPSSILITSNYFNLITTDSQIFNTETNQVFSSSNSLSYASSDMSLYSPIININANGGIRGGKILVKNNDITLNYSTSGFFVNTGINITENSGFNCYIRASNITALRNIQLPDDSGTFALTSNIFRKITLNIGDWDMFTNSTKVVPHGLSSEWKNIRDITVIIRNDNDNSYNKIEIDGSVDNYNSTNINLKRGMTGLFNSMNYNSTSYNRGYITIFYI